MQDLKHSVRPQGHDNSQFVFALTDGDGFRDNLHPHVEALPPQLTPDIPAETCAADDGGVDRKPVHRCLPDPSTPSV